MRPLRLSLALSSIILGGWLNAARAQTPPVETPNPESPSVVNPAPEATGEGSPGEIPQPTLDAPGVVVGVMLGQIYTDNVRLTANDPESSWLTLIQPFVRAATNGPRFSGVVNYALSGYLYLTGPSDNQIAQDLFANGTLTLVPQHLFLDGYASYGRQGVNNALPSGSGLGSGLGSGSGNGAFFLDENQTNAAVGSLSPYWVQDLGNVGTMTVRYSLGRVVYTDRGIPAGAQGDLNGISNATSNAGQFGLTSPEGQRWGWNLGYAEQRISPDVGSSTTFAIAHAGTSYQLNDSVQLLADVGKETNFLPDGTTEKLGASFWDAGLEWSGARDHVRALAGHRFYGGSLELSWTHTAARLTTNVDYTQQPTNYNQQLLGFGTGGGPLPPINPRPPTDIPSLTEINPYLSKRLTASATYTMPRSTLRAQVYDELRDFFDEEIDDERVASANIDWQFTLGPRTTLTPAFWWERYQFQSGQVTYTRNLDVTLAYQFNAKNFGHAGVYHGNSSVQAGEPGARGYTVNTIYLDWVHLF